VDDDDDDDEDDDDRGNTVRLYLYYCTFKVILLNFKFDKNIKKWNIIPTDNNNPFALSITQ
jgi:hypothetical protein